jgi:DNA-binding response OmpR family regulator
VTRVLVIEDDAGIREITQLALESMGFDVRTASTGQHALEAVAREPVDAILLDVRMPLMDGAEFARRYRARTERPAPIIVLTAARTDHGHDVFAGSRYIEKPFDLDDLARVINEVVAEPA